MKQIVFRDRLNQRLDLSVSFVKLIDELKKGSPVDEAIAYSIFTESPRQKIPSLIRLEIATGADFLEWEKEYCHSRSVYAENISTWWGNILETIMLKIKRFLHEEH